MQRVPISLVLCVLMVACHSATSNNAAQPSGTVTAATSQVEPTANSASPSKTAPNSFVIKVDASGQVVPDSSNPALKDVSLTVDPNLSFGDKLTRYIAIYNELIQLDAQAQANKTAAKAAANLSAQVSAQDYIDAAEAALLPYSVAEGQAESAISDGYKLNDVSGNICKTPNDCKPINAQAALFFFLDRNKQALGPAFAKAQTGVDGGGDQLPGGDNGDIYIESFNVSEAVRVLSSKPLDTITAGILPRLRDSVLPKDHNGELTRATLDPVHYPDDVIQKLAKHAGVANNTGVQVAINPVRCLSHLFKKHSKKC